MSDDRKVASTADALQKLNGTPRYKNVISATTTEATLAIPVPGAVYLIQPDATVTVTVKDASSSTLTATTGIVLVANQQQLIWTAATDTVFAAITSTGTANVKIFQLA